MEKIKQAVEEARRHRETLGGTGVLPNTVIGLPTATLEARIRRLTPIDRLPRQEQQAVIRAGEIISVPRNARIFLEGSKDEYVHYLLDGGVALLINGLTARRFSANSNLSALPLDEPGQERACSAVAEQPSQIFRIRHALVDQRLALTEPAAERTPDPAAVSEANLIALLRKDLFANLSEETIRKVLARVDEVEVKKGRVVVDQGSYADYFYLVKAGTAEVRRRFSPESPPVHVAEIHPGGGFGEEALIGNCPRGATVTMTSDGVLLKLEKNDFNALIRDPLLNHVDFDEAERLVAGDAAVWVDAREPARFAESAMPGAINVPLAVLRLKYRELDPGRAYIVYSEQASTSAVAAFLLCSRGLNARYVNDEVYPPLSDPLDFLVEETAPAPAEADINPQVHDVSEPQTDIDMPDRTQPDDDPVDAAATPSAPAVPGRGPDWTEMAPAQPEFYADTQSGQGLAALVEEIRSDSAQIATEVAQDPAEATATGNATVRLDDTFFKIEIDPLDEGPAAGEEMPVHAPPPSDRVQDAIGKALHDLEAAFRDHVAAVRHEERERIEQQVQERVALIRKRAEQMMREKLSQARARDRERNKLVEDRLHQQYEKLQRLANRITHQKAEIQRARRQLEQKLTAANVLHRELTSLGQTITQEIDSLEGMMPDDDIKLSG